MLLTKSEQHQISKILLKKITYNELSSLGYCQSEASNRHSDKPYMRGLKAYNPFVSRVFRISTQTENLEIDLRE